VLRSISVGGYEKSWFVGDEMRLQTWRWTGLPPDHHSHVCSLVLGEVYHCLVDVFFPDGLQVDFQPIKHLRLRRSMVVKGLLFYTHPVRILQNVLNGTLPSVCGVFILGRGLLASEVYYYRVAQN